jgi:hypothetical protein
MDLGGIINHTEQLIGGLKDLGHTVHFYEMCYSERVHALDKQNANEIGPSGIRFGQGCGWSFPLQNRLPYKTSLGLRTTIEVLNSYDLVIWTVPVPPKNKLHLGNNKWPLLYNLKPHVKQLAFIHDGNSRDGAPHLLHIEEKLSAIACVHSCALNGSDHLTPPRALILNPQEIYFPTTDWDQKLPGFVNMQTFKAWKHAHELIESIAYMKDYDGNSLREVAGKGIEYQYMTSEDKCKPQYYHGVNDHWFSGMTFWEAALANGMTHHEYWSTSEVHSWLEKARVLVDPSWSKKYSKIGGHWNRVVVDAMIHGAIPVAQQRGMGSDFFKPGVHYIDLGEATDPYTYGKIIDDAGNMSIQQARPYLEENALIIKNFERATVAKRLLDLVNGELDDVEYGFPDHQVMDNCDSLLFNHYGIVK